MQDILQWLETLDYDIGVALYDKYGSNSFFKSMLSSGPTDFNRSQLLQELSVLVKDIEPLSAAEPQAAPEQARTEPPAAQASNPADAARYLDAVRKRDRLYRELNVLMEQKFYLSEGEQLKDCCRKILFTNQRITDLWALTDFYQEHGNFPGDEESTDRPVDVQIAYLETSLSKARSRLKSPSCRNPEKTKELIAKKVLQLDNLKGRLING